MASFYDLKATDITGREVSFSDYKNKVVLIVNTASECGFTPQYEGLEKLHQKHGKDGLVILGFPCNQFGGQEPGDESEIQKGCLINYGVTFQMFSKVDVNGENEHAVFTYLKNHLKGTFGNKIKWNFTKFLFDKNGNAIDRFSPTTKPNKIEPVIVKLIDS